MESNFQKIQKRILPHPILALLVERAKNIAIRRLEGKPLTIVQQEVLAEAFIELERVWLIR